MLFGYYNKNNYEDEESEKSIGKIVVGIVYIIETYSFNKYHW